MTSTDASSGVAAEYFDGHSARAHRVVVRVDSGHLAIEGDGIVRTVPLARLEWPERTRHGARLLQLPDGGSLHCRDSLAWDTWSARVAGRRDSLVVRAQQRWRWTAASLLAVVLIFGAGYRWGLPLAADAVVARLPASIDESVGDAALQAIDQQQLVGPSTLSVARQTAISRSFADAVSHLPPGTAAHYELAFRDGRSIGPNAFALPGGAMVITDELVERVHGDRAMIVGVLGHELGHLRHRHGMRMLVEASAVGAAAGALYGDFSALLALVPTWLAQASYSRDAEREADVESVRLLRANGLSPAVMARFFDVVRQSGKSDKPAAAAGKLSRLGLGLGLASHPADAERVEFFEQAAAGR
jgi:Zn-dependent protease with chaperone function